MEKMDIQSNGYGSRRTSLKYKAEDSRVPPQPPEIRGRRKSVRKGDDEFVGFKRGKLYTTSITDLLNHLLDVPCCRPRFSYDQDRIQALLNSNGNQCCSCPFHACAIPKLVPVRCECPRPWICRPPRPTQCCQQCPCPFRPCINIALPPCSCSPTSTPCCSPRRQCQRSWSCGCPCPCPCPCRCPCPCSCRCPPCSLPVLDRRSPYHFSNSWRHPPWNRCGSNCGCCDCDCCCYDQPLMYNNCNFYQTPMRSGFTRARSDYNKKVGSNNRESKRTNAYNNTRNKPPPNFRDFLAEEAYSNSGGNIIHNDAGEAGSRTGSEGIREKDDADLSSYGKMSGGHIRVNA